MATPFDRTTICLKVARVGTPTRYLDGQTYSNEVLLAPDPWGYYTGTHWTVEPLDDGNVSLHCCGHLPGTTYLAASAARGVYLAPDTSDLGAHWRPSGNFSGPDPAMELDNYLLNPAISPNHHAYVLAVFQPYGGYPGNSVGLTGTPGPVIVGSGQFLATTIFSIVPVQQAMIGKILTFGFLWVQSPPQYLDGRTGDNSVGMAPNTTYSGTRWKVVDHGDGTVLFQCQGDNPATYPYLKGNDDGSVSLTTNSGDRGTRWTVTQTPPQFQNGTQVGGGYNFQCIDQPDAYLAAYDRSMSQPADLIAANGNLGLAAYWQILGTP